MPHHRHISRLGEKRLSMQLNLSLLDSLANSRIVPFLKERARAADSTMTVYDVAPDGGSSDGSSIISSDEASSLFESQEMDSAPTTPELSGDDSSDAPRSRKGHRRGAAVYLPQRVSSLDSDESSTTSWLDPNHPLTPPLALTSVEGYFSPLTLVDSRETYVTTPESPFGTSRRVSAPAFEVHEGDDIYTYDVATRVKLYEVRLVTLASLSPAWWIESSGEVKIGRAQVATRQTAKRIPVLREI